MIFASDLDRTIAYSERAILELGEKKITSLKPIEQKDDRWVGYMTEESYNKLQEISQTHLFIPVTTRTTEQFNRFVIFKDINRFPYSITYNGAVILYKGIPLEEWSEQLINQMEQESVLQTELLDLLRRRGIIINGLLKQAGDYFFYYILESLPLKHDRMMLHELVAKAGWRISLQGKKLYFIPKAISKGAALEFICKREGLSAIAGAGDSILDWDFLQHCKYRFVPGHGELASVRDHKDYILAENSGPAAGEEILKQFLKLGCQTS
jgi:hydroxymethylpyrimidine pyrophosphatase-like HAD family hydrolase